MTPKSQKTARGNRPIDDHDAGFSSQKLANNYYKYLKNQFRGQDGQQILKDGEFQQILESLEKNEMDN